MREYKVRFDIFDNIDFDVFYCIICFVFIYFSIIKVDVWFYVLYFCCLLFINVSKCVWCNGYLIVDVCKVFIVI